MSLVNPLDGIVRILKQDDSTAGTGFLAGNERSNSIITCAHVVVYAGARPGGSVRVVFHHDGQQVYTARVLEDGWREPEAEDVAVLELEAQDEALRLPEGVRRVALGSSLYTLGRTLNTFGFPAATPVEGQHGSCLVIGRGKVNGCEVIQLRSKEVSYGFSGAPVWDSASGFVVGMVTGIIPYGADEARPSQETAFITPIETIRHAYSQLSFDDKCPYQGFELFEAEDKDFYFGRDEAIEEMVTALVKNDLTTIVGVSGSGKSSLVRAGLAKGLEKWKYPELVNRQICIFKPGPTPFLNLLIALCSLEGRTYAAVEHDFQLPAGSLEHADLTGVRDVLREKTTAEIAELLRAHCRGREILLIADQFERLYTECTERLIQDRVVDILLQAAGDEVKVLIALRIDFYGTALEHGGFAQAIKAAEIKLLSMNDEELKSTIVSPATSTGRTCEPELVASLVNDVRGRAGDLPILQFALKELWEMDAATGVLTIKSYDSLGYVGPGERVTGVRGAIIKRAEEIWAQLEKRGEAQAAERVFLTLVLAAQSSSTANGLPMLDASRRAHLTEFDEKTRRIVYELTSSFLLTTSMDPFTGKSVVEVSHEALIQYWPRLHRWVKDRRPFLNWYSQNFILYLQRWEDEKDRRRKRKLLLPEVMIAEAQQWQRQYPSQLTGPPAEYIKASVMKVRRKRIYQAMALAAALIAIGVIAYAMLIRSTSKADEFRERGIQALLGHDYQQAQLLLAESLDWSDSDATRHHLLEARANGALAVETSSPTQDVLAATPDGNWLAFGSKGVIKVWDRMRGSDKQTSFPVDDPKDVRVALSPDGQFLAYGDDDGNVRLWDFSSGQELPDPPPASRKADNTSSAIDSIAFTADGRKVAYGNMEGFIEIWDRTAPGNPTRRLSGHSGSAVHNLTFSPDGTRLASGGGDFSVHIWKLDTGGAEPERVLFGHEDFITSLAFSSAPQNLLASGGADGSVRVWNLDGQEKGADYMLIGHLGRVKAVAFNHDNSLILSGSEDQTVRLWSTSVRKEILKLRTYGYPVNIVAFGGDDSYIVSGGEGGSVRSWQINSRTEGMTLYNNSPVAAVAFHPHSSRLAIGGLSGPIKIWDPTARSVSELTGSAEGIDALAFRSSDGLLASGTYEGEIQLWNVDSRSLIRSFKIGKAVWGLAFTPTAPLLAAGGQDKQIHLWNILTGQEAVSPLNHDNVSVWSITFNSDGSLMASGGGDGKIRIWQTADFQRKATFTPANTDELWGVPFDTSDKQLISGGLDREVRLWSVEQLLTGQSSEPLEVFKGHEGIIQSVVVSPDGVWVASAGSDHTVRLWNLQTKEGVRLELHDRPVWWVAFNQKGTLFGSGGLDNRVRIGSMAAVKHVLEAPAKTLLAEAQRDTCLRLNADDTVEYTVCKNTKTN